MGVKDLWKILEPVRDPVGIGKLSGLTLAVDLSVWVCEAEGVQEMKGRVAKPYLRNLFFRVCNLQQLGVQLVFVVDGEPPELKLEEIARRTQARLGGAGRGRGRGGSVPRRAGRSHFKALLRQCCGLLELMGVPYIQSQGEAEALCALLNLHQLADGVITNDGDAFLYGATTVYRNFAIDRRAQENTVDKYTLSAIESSLRLDRDKLLALGLLLGCDYVPKGVPGVGQTRAVRLMQELPTGGVLDRLCLWRSERFVSGSAIEEQIRDRARALPDFPSHKVIQEFTKVKDKLPKRLPQATRPKMFTLQRLLMEKLEWEESYALEKVLPLVTMYDMRHICADPAYRLTSRCLRPHSILKARVRQFVPVYELQWHTQGGDAESGRHVTLEEQVLVNRCFPELVQAFEASRAKPKPKKTKKKDKIEDKENLDPRAAVETLGERTDLACDQLASLSINTQQSGRLAEHVSSSSDLQLTSHLSSRSDPQLTSRLTSSSDLQLTSHLPSRSDPQLTSQRAHSASHASLTARGSERSDTEVEDSLVSSIEALSLRERLQMNARVKKNFDQNLQSHAAKADQKTRIVKPLGKTSNVQKTEVTSKYIVQPKPRGESHSYGHVSAKSKTQNPSHQVPEIPSFLDESIDDLLITVHQASKPKSDGSTKNVPVTSNLKNTRTLSNQARPKTVSLSPLLGDSLMSDSMSFCVKRTLKTKNKKQTTDSNISVVKRKSRTSASTKADFDQIQNVTKHKEHFKSDKSVFQGSSYARSLQAALKHVTGHEVDVNTQKSVTSHTDVHSESDDDDGMLPLSQRILLRASQSSTSREPAKHNRRANQQKTCSDSSQIQTTRQVSLASKCTQCFDSSESETDTLDEKISQTGVVKAQNFNNSVFDITENNSEGNACALRNKSIGTSEFFEDNYTAEQLGDFSLNLSELIINTSLHDNSCDSLIIPNATSKEPQITSQNQVLENKSVLFYSTDEEHQIGENVKNSVLEAIELEEDQSALLNSEEDTLMGDNRVNISTSSARSEGGNFSLGLTMLTSFLSPAPSSALCTSLNVIAENDTETSFRVATENEISTEASGSMLPGYHTVSTPAYCLKTSDDTVSTPAYCLKTSDDTVSNPTYCLKTSDDTVSTPVYCLKTSDDTVSTPVYCLKTSDDTVSTPAYCLKTSDDTVSTPTDFVKTSDETVSSPTDSVKTSDDTVSTSTDSVKTSDDKKVVPEVDSELSCVPGLICRGGVTNSTTSKGFDTCKAYVKSQSHLLKTEVHSHAVTQLNCSPLNSNDWGVYQECSYEQSDSGDLSDNTARREGPSRSCLECPSEVCTPHSTALRRTLLSHRLSSTNSSCFSGVTAAEDRHAEKEISGHSLKNSGIGTNLNNEADCKTAEYKHTLNSTTLRRIPKINDVADMKSSQRLAVMTPVSFVDEYSPIISCNPAFAACCNTHETTPLSRRSRLSLKSKSTLNSKRLSTKNSLYEPMENTNGTFHGEKSENISDTITLCITGGSVVPNGIMAGSERAYKRAVYKPYTGTFHGTPVNNHTCVGDETETLLLDESGSQLDLFQVSEL